MRPLDEVISQLWRTKQVPPRIERQVPPRPKVDAPEGSMLADALPVTRLKRSFVKVILYGRNRSGKTTLAGEIVKASGHPGLIISCEPDCNGGADSIANLEGCMLQRVSDKLLGQDRDGQWMDATDPRCVRKDRYKGSAKVVALAAELAGRHPFKNVILDTATSLQDIILCELMNWSAIPDQLSWGTVPEGVYQARSEKLRSVVRPLLDLKECNVVILCQEKDHNDTGEARSKSKRRIMGTMQQDSFMGPSVGTAVAGWLQDNSGYVLQIYEDELYNDVQVPQMNADGTEGEPMIQKVGTGKRQRHLRLLYHPNFAAGGRIVFDPTVPEFVTAPTPRGLYEAMAAYIPALRPAL